MSIKFDKEKKVFELNSNKMSYIIKIREDGHIGHVYWGKKLRNKRISQSEEANNYPAEYPDYGRMDFHYPAYQVLQENGSRITNLKYQSHEIIEGKEDLDALPNVYVEQKTEAQTLKIILHDELIDLNVILNYTVFNDRPVITRSVKFENKGQENLQLKTALSSSVNFDSADFDLLQLSGTWSRERYVKKRSLKQGVVSIDSKRGISSHEQNPFIALMRAGADEQSGEVYGFNFVYSGNFIARAEVNNAQQTRVTMGLNPFDFNWLLEPQTDFQTPEVVMVYADQGLNEMSQVYHELYRNRLVRGKYRDQTRPVLLNNWEATYFDFDTDKLLSLASDAADLGIELFVLDDGWFGERHDDTSSLGDWFVNEDKLPGGLEYLGQKVNEMGMKFGLWFEPEMISPDSDLYEQHPDWCIHIPQRKRSQARHQLVLDLLKPEVREYIIERVSAILNKAPISYVKWDMNRPLSEIGSDVMPPERQQEVAHRYVLALYEILEEITNRFPDVLFESCSSGGGRFDPGMLYYMPQTWTSDNTDAVERLKIQYGTSIVYPLSAIGAHVSAVPNHQLGRVTPLDTRGKVAMFGNFGYELDITELDESKKEKIKEQVSYYKEVRKLVQQGQFYRLITPFENNETAWMVVSQDKTEALLGYYQILAEPVPPKIKFRLQGLEPDKKYEFSGSEGVSGTYYGDELMYDGLEVDINPFDNWDYRSFIWKLESKK